MAHSGFNPYARWDRQVFQKDVADGQVRDERISVLAWFQDGKIMPREFIWRNRRYKIKEITYNWRERKGRERISFFSVSTGADLYQISFNNITFGWRLNRVIG